MNPGMPRRLVIGITGATGTIYGIRALQILRGLGVETHLVISRAGEIACACETAVSRKELDGLADYVHPIDDVAASISSGSFRTIGMLIAPCSMHTLAEVATGVTSTLLTRAADVVLKERRTLVMMVREAPLHVGHIRNMLAAAEMGAIIHPPVPAFYVKPKTIDDIIDYTLGRVLACFGIDVPGLPCWEGPADQKTFSG